MNYPTKDTLFYDGQCPLCSREIGVLNRLTKGRVNFQDIHQAEVPGGFCQVRETSPHNLQDNMPDKHMPDKQSLLKVLHLQKPNGQWLKGLDANVAVWRHTTFGVLFLVFKLPVVKQIAKALYDRWATLRYEKLYSEHKQDDVDCGCAQTKR